VRKSIKATFVTAGAALAFGISTQAASADTTPTYGVGTGSGVCIAAVTIVDPNQDYAQGIFTNVNGDAYCNFTLQRAYISGGVLGSFSPIGSFATTPDKLWAGSNQTTHMSTGAYWDGPDVRVRACVSVTWNDGLGWATGPTQCSPYNI